MKQSPSNSAAQEQTQAALAAMRAYFAATAQARPRRERQRLAHEGCWRFASCAHPGLDPAQYSHCYRELLPPTEGIGQVQWYGTRWIIEVFFRIFKTGCRVEVLQLNTLACLEPALASSLIIAWRIQSRTVLGRGTPEWPCDAALNPTESQASRSPSTVSSHRQPHRRNRRCAAGSPPGWPFWAHAR
jgi:hypothetical protein